MTYWLNRRKRRRGKMLRSPYRAGRLVQPLPELWTTAEARRHLLLTVIDAVYVNAREAGRAGVRDAQRPLGRPISWLSVSRAR